MQIFQNESFYYKSNELFCEEIPVSMLAREFGTPLFIYSRYFFENRFKLFNNAFSKINHRIFFAVKSNFNINVIRLFYLLGAGVDVNSAGELFRAIKAGVKPEDIIFSGVGKTDEEIVLGLNNKIKFFKAESLGEIILINNIAKSLNRTANIAIRVNPDVDPKTHPYISTGLKTNKFGINTEDAFFAFKEAARMHNIKIVGLDMHIGSQVLSVDAYKQAVERLSELYYRLKDIGIKIEHFDIGGGMGVRYKEEETMDVELLAEILSPLLNKLDCQILFEPGRYLTANGGILVAKALYEKSNGQKNFLIIDAAMTELLRPSLYKAYHHIQPVKLKNNKEITVDVVGGVCESGDYLAKDRKMEKIDAGELLAILGAGAYGMTMSSNYNGRRRPPEILVEGNKVTLIRSRETFEHLLYDEEIKI